MQEVAEQDRQHQHETVQHRDHDRGPAPLQRPAALGPQFGGRQRRIDRNDAGADRHAHGGGFGRQRHDGGDPGDGAQNQPRQIGLAAMKTRAMHSRPCRRSRKPTAFSASDSISPSVVAGERPERHRRSAEQIGGSPPFQRRDILLLAEEQQHGSQQRCDHGGNEIKRGGIEQHGGHQTIVMPNCRRGQNQSERRRHLGSYDRRVGNPFARTRKFSRKTASTHR